MKFDLTQEQYQRLVELVYFGEWLVNASRTKPIDKYEDIQQYIYSFAKDNDLPFMNYHKNFDSYELTNEYEKSIHHYIDEYDENIFLEQLVHKLADRDLFRQIGPVSKLTDAHQELRYELIDKYTEELNKNGLKNLVIQS